MIRLADVLIFIIIGICFEDICSDVVLLKFTETKQKYCKIILNYSFSFFSTGTPSGGPGVKFQSLLGKHVEMKSIISASYLCDFGNVILGLKRKRMFKILNATATGERNKIKYQFLMIVYSD